MGKKNNWPDNLYKRKDSDVWYIRYNNAEGRKIRQSLETTSVREAKRIRDEILGKRSLAARLGLEPPVPKKEEPTFLEIAEKWKQTRRASDLRRRTISITEGIVDNWHIPFFGSKRMCDITVDDVEAFIVHLRYATCRAKGREEQPLSQTTIANIFRYLGSLYRTAARRGWYKGMNPIMQIDRPPRPGPGRDVFLTEDEARALLDELSGKLYYKVGLALSTGLRWGEIHGLAWSDIVLYGPEPTLTVCRSYQGPPKNDASKATIPLSDSAAAMLRRWRQELGMNSRYVFPTPKGEIPTERSKPEIKRLFAAVELAGIDKHVTPHTFRHTFGTWLYEKTRDPKMVQRLMRHAHFATSMNYVHDRRSLTPAVNLLPALTRANLKAI